MGQINEHSDSGMNHQGLATARPTCPAYVDGRKRENSYFFKDRITVASTCRRSYSLVVA